MVKHSRGVTAVIAVGLMVWLMSSIWDTEEQNFWTVMWHLLLAVMLAQVLIWLTYRLSRRWERKTAMNYSWLVDPEPAPLVPEIPVKGFARYGEEAELLIQQTAEAPELQAFVRHQNRWVPVQNITPEMMELFRMNHEERMATIRRLMDPRPRDYDDLPPDDVGPGE